MLGVVFLGHIVNLLSLIDGLGNSKRVWVKDYA